MKVAILGGGGFRAPIMYRALGSVYQDLGLDEVALHDPSRARLHRIESVIRGMEMEHSTGLGARVTDRLEEAVEGAAFVLCAIRVGGLAGRVVDETVPLGLGVLGQETVGPAGIAFALRTVPVVESIARTVAGLAPRAWFLNFTNPAGLVTEAARDVLGERAIGICDSPAALCRGVGLVLERDPDVLWFDYFGLNHAGWLRAVRGADGDLLPSLLADDDRLGHLPEAWALGLDCIREIRMIPNEYLAYYLFPDRIRDAFRRADKTRGEVLLEQQDAFYSAVEESPQEALMSWRRARAQRDRTYMAEARNNPGDDLPASTGAANPGGEDHEETGYAAVAVDCMRSLVLGGRSVQILGTANRGSMAFLDSNAVVEVPCVVGPAGPVPLAVDGVPDAQREMIERLKAVERTTIRAARTGSRKLAVQALAMHPLVPSRDVAERIFDGYLEGHPSLRERFA